LLARVPEHAARLIAVTPVMVRRTVSARRGKWRIVSEEVAKGRADDKT